MAMQQKNSSNYFENNMKKKIFSFLISETKLFRKIFSIYLILYIIIINWKNFLIIKKINVLVLNRYRFNKSEFIFKKLKNYNLFYFPVKLQSTLLIKWNDKLKTLRENTLKKINLKLIS